MKKILFAVFLVLFLAGCAAKQASQQAKELVLVQSSPSTDSRNVNVPHSVLEKVKIKDFAFQPDVVRIKAGDSVEWEQFDQVPHTVTLVSGPEEFDSGSLRKGDKWVKTFEKPGVYEYTCTPHSGMKGKVVVE